MSTGGFCHTEFPTTDVRASRAFYSAAFGWTFLDMPGMDDYVLFRTPGGQEGGFSGGPHAEPPTGKGPILHVEVDDIDRALATITRLGGRTLTSKTRISDEFGYYALFLDNVGNRLGLWSRA